MLRPLALRLNKAGRFMSDSQALSGEEEISWFWEEVEGDVKATLTAAQRIAIEDAVRKSTAQSQPADVRLYLGKYFVRIVAGKERRNRERLKQDLKDNPVFALKNIPLLAVVSVLWILAVLYIVMFTSAVIAHWFF